MLPIAYNNKLNYVNTEEEIIFIDQDEPLNFINQKIITNEVTFKTEGDISIKKEV